MLWRYGLACLLLLLGDAHGDDSRSRVRRQDPAAPNGQLIDSIFNIPITAIRQTAAAAQVISPDNTQAIDSVFKIPVSTLEAVGQLVKSTSEQRRQNAEEIQRTRQERRDRLLALKEQKRRRKEEIQDQRLRQQQLKRVVRHHRKDPFGLNALSDLLVGHGGPLAGGAHHHAGGHGLHGHSLHGILGGHGGHGILGGRPQNTYEVHENVDEGTSFSWHGLTAGFGSFFSGRPTSAGVVKIENKIAPKETRQKFSKYPSDGAGTRNGATKIVRTRPEHADEPPLENKVAPRTSRVTFVR